jgi:hypothetical protein
MRDAAPPPRELKWTARLHRLSTYLPGRGRFVGGAAQGLMSAAAAIVPYLPTKLLGLQEGGILGIHYGNRRGAERT